MSFAPEHQPQLEILPTIDAVADRAADLIAQAIAAPDAVLGVATGRTPLPIYARLRQRAANGMGTAHLRAFALDEYCGVAPDHQASYRGFLEREFFGPIGLPADRWQVPDGLTVDATAETSRYETAIRAAGGIGLQLLGVGRNGHIGFNEPGSAFDSLTRAVDLTEDTREANAGDFPPGEVTARQALTMGIGTILRAKRLLMVVTGPAKARVLAAMLEGPVTAAVPATAIRLHPDAIVLVDSEAAAQLTRARA